MTPGSSLREARGRHRAQKHRQIKRMSRRRQAHTRRLSRNSEAFMSQAMPSWSCPIGVAHEIFGRAAISARKSRLISSISLQIISRAGEARASKSSACECRRVPIFGVARKLAPAHHIVARACAAVNRPATAAEIASWYKCGVAACMACWRITYIASGARLASSTRMARPSAGYRPAG